MTPVRTLFAKGSVYTSATAIQLSGSALVMPAVTRRVLLVGPFELEGAAASTVAGYSLLALAVLLAPAWRLATPPVAQSVARP